MKRKPLKYKIRITILSFSKPESIERSRVRLEYFMEIFVNDTKYH